MTSTQPTDKDLYDKVSLHAILEVEVAIRHTWLFHRAELEALRGVRARADELAKDVPVSDAGELIANVFFEAIELRCSPRRLLADYTTWMDDDEYDAVNAVLRTLWEERNKEVFALGATLPAAKRFRLGDLSWQNDLPSLLYWCIFTATAQPHEIGPQERIDEDGKKYIAHIVVSMPARVPRPRAADNFAIYDADIDEVCVNGSPVRGAMLVLVDTQRQIDNFPDIVDAFGAHLGTKQAVANWLQFQNGVLPTIDALSVSDLNRKLARQRDSFEVLPRSDRPETMLKGLICWDLHKVEKKSIGEACEEVGLILRFGEGAATGAVTSGIRNNYEAARKQILAGKLLTWKDLSAKRGRSKSADK